jgi:protein SCO1/2
MKKNFYIISFLLFLCPIFLHAEKIYQKADVVQHVGAYLPLNLYFVDEAGKKVLLKNLINKPTVLDFCYYRCTGICTPLMVELADVMTKSNLEPGIDYNVISVSIDPSETYKMAEQKKNTMLLLIDKKVPESAWKFLTGDITTIKELTKAAGFYYVKENNTFLHKGVLIFINNNGKICYYLRPGYSAKGDFSILPSEFEIAINETSKGEVIASLSKTLQTCFTYRPKSKGLLVFGVIFLVGIISVSTVLIIIKRTNVPVPKKSFEGTNTPFNEIRI